MNVRHILGISGGKDSAALAIYLKQKYPTLKIEYYNSDTGCELTETETLINRLEAYLGKIERLRAAEGSPEPTPFHHFLKAMGGFLPSPQARWCTQKMKLAEFERYVGDDLAISFVGIRGDEDRDGYISNKPNIQAVFPFRRNIWSIDVINKVLHNENLEQLIALYDNLCPDGMLKEDIMGIVRKPLSKAFYYSKKMKRKDIPRISQYNYGFQRAVLVSLHIMKRFRLKWMGRRGLIVEAAQAVISVSSNRKSNGFGCMSSIQTYT